MTWTGAGAGTTAAAALALWMALPPTPAPVYPLSSNNNSVAILPAEPTTPAAIPNDPMAVNSASGGSGAEVEVKTNRPATFLPENPMGNSLGPVGDG